ncbi:hypothetical protein WR25_12786 [Diploscapter pachys]|uniref:Uncharacterized protein n=1 Tax=Diploscapter pachys TaxID=2018661 RepID=A0A2A2LGU5_9BILA|nr:hypothetical protein WR25_12786 [Diploscapter pachys]
MDSEFMDRLGGGNRGKNRRKKNDLKRRRERVAVKKRGEKAETGNQRGKNRMENGVQERIQWEERVEGKERAVNRLLNATEGWRKNRQLEMGMWLRNDWTDTGLGVMNDTFSWIPDEMMAEERKGKGQRQGL